jgi:hypothetical protein
MTPVKGTMPLKSNIEFKISLCQVILYKNKLSYDRGESNGADGSNHLVKDAEQMTHLISMNWHSLKS